VLELAAAELRVDRDERDPGRDRGDHRDDRLELWLGPDRDALGAREPAGQRGGGAAQLVVAERAPADGDGRRAA
jgi:hypothetical protein